MYTHSALYVSTDATSQPVTLDEAKQHLEFDAAHRDDKITSCIKAATRICQQIQGRQYINATWIANYDYFPREIVVPLPPLSSVTTFAYVDQNGDDQTLTEDTDFIVNTAAEPGRIKPHPDSTGWPSIQTDGYNPITITFVAGYGADADSVKEDVKEDVLAVVAHLMELREPVAIAAQATDLPHNVFKRLLRKRVWRF